MAGTTTSDVQEGGLARFAQRMAGWFEKWFPDAYVFALVGVVVVTLAALVNGSSPKVVAQAFGGGFWDLAEFTLQMAMVVLSGYIVATSPPVAKLIERIATVPNSARGAVAFVALLSCLVSLLNWGLSLVFSGLLARAIARRPDLKADYRALVRAAYMGLGAVWALGLSSSAAQLQATAASLPPDLLKITGVLDFGATIFTWQSLTDGGDPDRADGGDLLRLRASGQVHPDGRGDGRGPRRHDRAAAAAGAPGGVAGALGDPADLRRRSSRCCG